MLPAEHIETWDHAAGVLGALRRACEDNALIRRVAEEYARTHEHTDGPVRVWLENGNAYRFYNIEHAETLSKILHVAGVDHKIEY